ncbi:flavin-dependent monooxygenase QhpG [Undibacterium sp. Ji50W]|uniref:flavin-dependent monooxygenase QhpG n=1 Tax=Undibacterium sp. Ji50W TaxID=3413041 RepID=UPI003BF3AC6E
MDNAVDIIIIGAGPAGLTAALRLQQLGYRVQMLERSATWPRPQIGEALTPGVKNIIDMLDANEALAAVPHLAGLSTRLRWRSATPEIAGHGDAAVINRAAFDAALLQLARQRGISVCMPARIEDISGTAGNWQLHISTPAGRQQITARFILDAGGRSTGVQQYACAPRLSAMWVELEADQISNNIAHNIANEMANLTQVEALEHGWLWGTRLPDLRYRVMLVNDPQTAHQKMPGQAENWLRWNCANSQLFKTIAQVPYASRLQACVATPYLALDSWQDGRLKLGDAAFALDPISSSGVEKAMRFSLQAVVAIHTLLGSTDSNRHDHHDRHELARHFFEQRLTETCARHQYWTQSYYAQAWCSEHPFWRSRAGIAANCADGAAAGDDHPLVRAMHEQSAQLRDYQPAELKPLSTFNPCQPLRIHPAASLAESYCVVDDRVQKQLALSHPNLERPISFLENQALFPHLNFLWQPQPLAQVLQKLEHSMGRQTSQKITAWLWQRGVLESLV